MSTTSLSTLPRRRDFQGLQGTIRLTGYGPTDPTEASEVLWSVDREEIMSTMTDPSGDRSTTGSEHSAAGNEYHRAIEIRDRWLTGIDNDIERRRQDEVTRRAREEAERDMQFENRRRQLDAEEGLAFIRRSRFARLSSS